MPFEEKKSAIFKKDKSNKGSIDKPILPLINLINSLNDYYTTSSCAGRIILIKVSDNEKKNGSEFIFRKHNIVTFEEIKQCLVENKRKEAIWLKQSPMILHVASRNFKSAQKMLNIARKAGLKRSGIITVDKNFIIEILGTEYVETIVTKNNSILIDDNYLKILIQEANKKLERSRERLKKFYTLLKTENEIR